MSSEKTPLQPSEELLFRQVRGKQGYIEDDEPTSYAFRPLPKDKGELSVDCQSKIDAQASFETFKKSGGDTVGVWGVTTKECHDLKLPPYHAPKLDEPANPAHGVVDFNGYEKDKDRKKKSGLLVEKAIARKRVFPPVEAPATPSAPAAAPSTGT